MTDLLEILSKKASDNMQSLESSVLVSASSAIWHAVSSDIVDIVFSAANTLTSWHLNNHTKLIIKSTIDPVCETINDAIAIK